jgi:ribosomal protein L11 methyltransferase
MKMIEIIINCSGSGNPVPDALPYRLESIGFEGFYEHDQFLSAYIPSDQIDRERIDTILAEFGISPIYEINELPEKNWNEEWEKNFEPIVIRDSCYIRAPFHPQAAYPFEIVIEPKMSFGTGHHATTSLMISEMMDIDMQEKAVLDAGCGTGILAIFAEMLGAGAITAVDIDDWSYRNAVENTALNNCQRITVKQDDISVYRENATFDVILANINLNVLKASLQVYSFICKPGGYLLMSGILITDIETLKMDAEGFGFVFEFSKTLNNWAVIRMRKK